MYFFYFSTLFLFSFIYFFFFFGLKLLIYMKLFDFFYVCFYFNYYSVIFFFVLLMIVLSVLSFSSYYMSGSLDFIWFLSIYLLFILSMVFLMFCPDFLFFFLGWDGLGITSFLLIMFYHSSNSWYSGFKTFLIKRLGDSFLIVFFCLFMYDGFFFFLSFYNYLFFKVFIMLFLFGVFTKSSSYPFNSWLPVAMAAPTPVSALVHSSTLVTAGLYLLIQNWFYFSHFNHLISVLGFYTMVIGSLSSMYEWDLKKIMAYSTLSQLGLMFSMVSFKESMLCFYHLVSHACFKALLFMIAGIFLYNYSHNQDIRLLNGTSMNFFVLVVLQFCLFSLSGLLFFSGFYSKDSFLLVLGLSGNFFFNLIFILFLCLTLVYSYRMLVYLNFSTFTFNLYFSFFYKHLDMVMLFMLSVFLGYYFNSFFYNYTYVNYSYNCLYISLMVIMMFISYYFNMFYPSWFFSFSFKSNYLKSGFFSSLFNWSFYVNGLFNKYFLSFFIDHFNSWFSSDYSYTLDIFNFLNFYYWFMIMFLFWLFFFHF